MSKKAEDKNQVSKWNVYEIDLESEKEYENPYLDVELQVRFLSPSKKTKIVRGFWDGANAWKVRFAPQEEGEWTWQSRSSDRNNRGLHDRNGNFHVYPYEGENPIYKHGFLRINANKRGFIHDDETPFFWLADTVWSIASKATHEEWKEYIDFRSKQGFNVVQINSLPQHDASKSEHRIPFGINDDNMDLSRINVEYFQYLDRIVADTVNNGIFPALVLFFFNYIPGTLPFWDVRRWGPFSKATAVAYTRYLGARYSAFGALWIVSGDTDLSCREAVEIYNAAGDALKNDLPYESLITAHICGLLGPQEKFNMQNWLDFIMFQSSHFVYSRERALYYAWKARCFSKTRPVLNGEPPYENMGFMDIGTGKKVKRELTREVGWSSILAGANAGVTYGAHGVWSWHRAGEVFADEWGEPLTDWKTALQFEGSNDYVHLKHFFETLQWWELKPAREIVVTKRNGESYNGFDRDDINAAVTEGNNMVVVYISSSSAVPFEIILDGAYEATWFNPATGEWKRHSRVLEDSKEIRDLPWSNDSVILLKKIHKNHK